MLQNIESFEANVVNPARTIKDGGLKKGIIVTVRAVESEQLLNGEYHVFFFVWNPTVKNWMLEEASQFEPMIK